MSAWDDIVRGLDPARQLPAVRETRSAVVSAGAGSGKTRVLAVRYLHLVKERGMPPERILCLTFTKKAAAEMSERIRGMLAACAVDDPVFARALEAFPASRVSTLDSFCADVARNGCARWGVPPDFKIDQDAAASSLDALAIDFLLKRRKEPIAASFIAACGFETAAGALIALAGGREGLIASDRRFDAAEQTAALAECLASSHERLYGLLAGGVELDTGTGKGGREWQERSAAFPPDPPCGSGQDSSVAGGFDRAGLEAAKALYQGIKALKKPTGKASGPAWYNAVADEAKVLAGMGIFACEALLDERRADALAMLRDFVTLAAETRAASGALSFSDVSAIALRTLENDLELRDWYKSRYDAVMVDEFQDDNDLQKRILYCIAERRGLGSSERDAVARRTVSPADLEPGVLFFVGDEKQSIYAFRGADVTVFRGLSSELSGAPGGLGAHSLDINWRSEPGLIDFFNKTFSAILPAPNDSQAQDFEARFAGLEPGPGTPGVAPAVVYLESNDPEGDDEVGSDEAEAWKIAELVVSLVRDRVVVAAKGPGGAKIARPCQWDDIAVLFRSTTSQNIVERYFRLLRVPYTAASTAGLFAESILGDLYAMLRLAVYPEDRLAFAAVLRGPFARLSDDAVFTVLSDGRGTSKHHRDGAFQPDGLMAFDAAGLPTDDAARFAAARESWLGVRKLADREPLRRIVEFLWYERGLRWNVLKDPAASSFLEHFDYAWSLAAAADARGERLVDLVAALEPRVGQLDRFDEVVLRESSRGVSIMTVHMSKGLEFPVVILPGAETRGQSDGRSPIAPAGRFGPSARLLDADGDPVDPVYELSAALKKLERGEGEDAMDEGLAETARLFYVACTRAISRLYLVGKVPYSADRKGQSFRSLFLRAWPWAGPESQSDEGFLSDRPYGVPELLSVEYVPARAKADYWRLANAPGPDGAARAAASAAAPALAVAERRGRWSVTGAAAFLDAAAAPAPGSRPRPSMQEPEPPASEAPGDEAVDGLPEADFGTLCHQFVESRLLAPAETPEPRGSIARALERLPEGERKREREAALAFAEAFIGSPRGRAAVAARAAVLAGERSAVFETEYPFVWRAVPDVQGSFPVALSGSMDLVYGDSTGVVVVDFKTDRHIDPERHSFQVSVYRDAAASIFGVPARAFVFYLRTGAEHEVSVKPDGASLAQPAR